MSAKLNEIIIDAFVIFFSLHGPFEGSYFEITPRVNHCGLPVVHTTIACGLPGF